MQPQIIKVNDIEKSIREVGLKYYVDRLLQDELGDYYWVEFEKVNETVNYVAPVFDPTWKVACIEHVDPENKHRTISEWYQYKIVKLPLAIAWFIIDALKLQSDVMGIGSGSYDEGPHGGRLKYYSVQDVNGKTKVEEIDKDVVRIEEL